MTKNKQLKLIRKNQVVTIFLLVVIVIAILMIPHATAQTITMANPSGIAERDIIVYYANGTMQGFYNSTSVISLDGATDYIFTLKPMRTTPLEDPGDWLTNEALPFAQTYFVPLIALVFLIALLRRR